MIEPDPCPWCGEVPKVRQRFNDTFVVECYGETCVVSPSAWGKFATREAAIAVWNERKYPKKRRQKP